MFIVNIAVPVPLRQLFSYTHSAEIARGVRVRVPFGSRELIGVVMACEAANEENDSDNLKPIVATLDTQPLINEELIQLGKWVSDYYHFPIGETLSTLLPAWLRKGHTDTELSGLLATKVFRTTPLGHTQLQSQSVSRENQKAVLEWLGDGEKSRAEAKSKGYESVLTTLRKKAWVEYTDSYPPEGIHWQSKLILGPKPTANPEQGVAIGALVASLNAFSISLLEGVTGSGKTEVYLQVIEQVLLNGRQVLVLVPEIGLTPQTVARFKARFNCEIGVLNSQVSDRQRAQIWMQAKAGHLPIVIGTRSAVFTPFFALGLVVIDEEHDDALKQQDSLRYHARDVAAVRAKHHNIPLLLGSATPSLESLNNALSGRFRHIVLNYRAAGAQTVNQHLVDMKHQPLHGGLSQVVIGQIRAHLDKGNQVLLFLNRRGYAPVLMCHDCGHVEVCHSCDRPMTWHKKQRRMHCHHCEIQRPEPRQCPQCHSTNIMPEGIGTEQLESTVKQLFPLHTVARIDRDNTRKKEAFDAIFDDVHQGKTDILIGTQMIAKGHHFPNVTLVVVVDVDAGLFSVDGRAQEKLAQLVTQLAGRAGRAEKKGAMVLQTHHPDHPMLQELTNNGYNHVARLLLAERKAALNPPFVSQALVRVEGHSQHDCQNLLHGLKQSLPVDTDVVFIGPMPALIEKRLNRFRMILALRSSTRRALHTQLFRAIRYLEADKLGKKLRWSVDVDAIDFT